MDFSDYFNSLDQKGRDRYARRAGTSSEYIRIHLVKRNRMPRPQLLQKLATASRGKVSYEEVVAHFYPDLSEAIFASTVSRGL